MKKEPASDKSALYSRIKKTIILVVGITVILIGIVMLVLPGPAVLVIPAGLAILATEFVWAAKLLHNLKKRLGFNSVQGGKS